jgi:hypothetical protein
MTYVLNLYRLRLGVLFVERLFALGGAVFGGSLRSASSEPSALPPSTIISELSFVAWICIIGSDLAFAFESGLPNWFDALEMIS